MSRFKIDFVSFADAFRILLLIFALACSKKDPEMTPAQRLAYDIDAIDKYLTSKGITAIEDDSGLRYVIHSPGSGPVAQLESRVKMKYHIWHLPSEAIIANSPEPPVHFTIPVANLIWGVQIGLTKIPVGSTATLFIPSGLGYGSSDSHFVPPNSILIFYLEFLDSYNNEPAVDADGNSYDTGIRGSYVTLTSNLKTAKYSNGESLSLTDWSYYENDQYHDYEYGKLYSFAPVTDARNLCPAGYHVPSQEEWEAGTDLRSGLYPGGSRNEAGVFSGMYEKGVYWSSKSLSAGDALAYTFYTGTGEFLSTAVPKETHASVLCIKGD